MKIVLASNNAGKIREFNSLLAPYAFDVVAQSTLGVEDVPETGLTFIENALIKARHAASITGLPVIADDSGLAVKALNGAPGICSARYAGESKSTQNNIQKLLREMSAVPDAERHATFHCVLVYMQSATDPTPIICEGRWHGVILQAPQGTLGFGYDPVFYLPELGKTSAELAPEVKNTLSHRGMALRAMVAALRGDE